MTSDRAVPLGCSASRTGAVILVLLAALAHVLVCAHGPVPAGGGHVDTPVAAAAFDCAGATEQLADTAAAHSLHGHGTAERCSGPDSPTLQPSRQIISPLPSFPSLAPAGAAEAVPDSAAADQPPPPHPGRTSAGQERARFGVWRT
ncbi:hypothetical protein ACH4FX_20000 [Streptomyces sp. NPDC018019]|uniref:hypothetical protein n=1 Tax=Streptomyces sp. NPDC018019 TaxID=3365030 RepID=UPI00378FBC62